MELIRECIEIALQAPSGSNRQTWHWLVITDAEKRAAIGEYYRRAVEKYLAGPGAAGGVVSPRPAGRAHPPRGRGRGAPPGGGGGAGPGVVLPPPPGPPPPP